MDFAAILEVSNPTPAVSVDLFDMAPHTAKTVVYPKITPRRMYNLDFFTDDELDGQTCDDINQVFTTETNAHAAEIIAFSLLSMALTSGVAIMMYRNPQLMAHPNKLIYYMCLCEGIVAWQAMISHLGPKTIICYFGLANLYEKTTWWENDTANVIQLMTTTNFNIQQFFEFVSLALNLFLCLDIVLTMRNPFYPHSRRMKFYLFFSIILSAMAFYMSLKRYSLPHDEDRLSTY